MDSAGRVVPLPVARSLREMGASLKAWRKLRGLTQAQLADRAGLDPRTVASLERGHGGVSIENLLRILNGLGIIEGAVKSFDPYETDLGRMRADEVLPDRVRPRRLDSDG